MEVTSQSLALIESLADGDYHSGEELGAQIGVSRAAIWKMLKVFSSLGLEVSRVRGKGYCLDGGLSLLNLSRISEGLPSDVYKCLDDLEVLPCVDSTNKYLLEKLASSDFLCSRFACLAEMQTDGRGRRGRHWQSPFGRNIYMSLCWQFQNGAKSMEGLSLAVGVAVAEALEQVAGVEVGLKWPNDILCGGSKLGGILIEIAGDATGECHAVIGVGLNVDVPVALMGDVDQPWIDLRALCSLLPARSALASALVTSLVRLLSGFEVRGFSSYRQAWEDRNEFASRQVCLQTPSDSIIGVSLGVSESGALRLLVDGEERHYVGGEISLRGWGETSR